VLMPAKNYTYLILQQESSSYLYEAFTIDHFMCFFGFFFNDHLVII
jgi:hypothetical protein